MAARLGEQLGDARTVEEGELAVPVEGERALFSSFWEPAVLTLRLDARGEHQLHLDA